MPQVMCEKITASIPPLHKFSFGGYSPTSPLYKQEVQFIYNRTMKKSRKKYGTLKEIHLGCFHLLLKEKHHQSSAS